jgi:hypothetical protein
VAAKKNKPASNTKHEGRSYADRDLKLLWGRAAARCSKCRCDLVAPATTADRAAIVGEIAHIVANSDTGPRPDPTFPKELRNKYENLILLCPNDHTPVDKQDSSFTVEDLRQWKADHERWVTERTREAVPGVGFAELEIVTKALVGAGRTSSSDFKLLDPAHKMAHNGLTDRVKFQLTLGLSKAREVEDFVMDMGKIDVHFPERLKAGFVQEYERYVASKVMGDALYEALASFASGGQHDFALQAAGRVVLAYLFEKCEVFER